MREYAKVIADSVHQDGVRLTTFEVRFWRPVLAEFNTHCVLSRNSASSRAIPLRKQVERVRRDAATPISWPAEQKGMQGGEELSESDVEILTRYWLDAAELAAIHAEGMGARGLHKSVANRLLEPFMWHTAVVTATAWDNFFEQRCSPLAQPEIRAVAELMQQAREESTPRPLHDGEWHLPYVDGETAREVSMRGSGYWARLACISAARCARVSYLTQDGKRDIDQDLMLYKRLVTARPAHWSPLEHVATPWLDNAQRQDDGFGFLGFDDRPYSPATEHLPRVGKLLKYRTLRTTMEAEQNAITFR